MEGDEGNPVKSWEYEKYGGWKAMSKYMSDILNAAQESGKMSVAINLSHEAMNAAQDTEKYDMAFVAMTQRRMHLREQK